MNFTKNVLLDFKYLIRILLRICYVCMDFNENFTKDFNRGLLKIWIGISQTILLRILLCKDLLKIFRDFVRSNYGVEFWVHVECHDMTWRDEPFFNIATQYYQNWNLRVL